MWSADHVTEGQLVVLEGTTRWRVVFCDGCGPRREDGYRVVLEEHKECEGC